MNRREFAKTTALLAASAYAQTPASDRVRVGLIGCGVRGSQLLATLQRVPAAECVMVADLYDGFLEHAKEMTNGAAETTKEYRRVLDRKDIDAVIVATPDHWHARIMTEAAQAGKDLYAEKPLVHKWEEAAPLMRVLTDTKRVVQVGSGRVGTALYRKAKEIVQSGRIGKVMLVSTCWDSAGGVYAWQYPIPPDASAQTIDWKRFLGQAPDRPYDPKRFFRWRCYWEYGGGIPPDLWSHHLTAINFILDSKMPTSVSANGGIHRFKDEREVPDTMSAHYIYPEGFSVTCSTTKTNSMRDQEFQFLGTDGSLVISRNELVVYTESGEEAYTYPLTAWPKKKKEQFFVVNGMDANGVPRVTAGPKPTVERMAMPARAAFGGNDHMANWIECIRTRKPCWETADMGARAALASIMANMSYQQKKTITWDQAGHKPV